jgi:histidinol dehydrogenase
MRTIEIRDRESFEQALRQIARPPVDAEFERRMQALLGSVRTIVEDVRARGDAAVAEWTDRLEGVSLAPEEFEIPPDAIEQAVRQTDPDLLAALQRAHDNIRRFHETNVRASWEREYGDGVVMGQRVTPLDSAGVYVPGGTAFYVSSALMNLVPAKAAGVPNIIVLSPPTHEGSIHPLILAATRIGGASRVFRMSGTPGVAALAYGTETVPAVVKITGPANMYVTLAKRLVSTVCDIDKEAGPSEVVVLADDKADPKLVAVELLAQAEHDEEAAAILVTTSAAMVRAVLEGMEEEMATLSRAAYIRKSLAAHGTVYVVQNLEQAAEITNAIAPEHLSIQVESPREMLESIRNAGCIGLGGMTPIAVGDYYAGPNHILPTGRRARYASPLTVDDFQKVSSVIAYTREGLAKGFDDIRCIAEAEGFTAHVRAVERRL